MDDDIKIMEVTPVEEDTWYDEEARSITACCHDYMDLEDGKLVCRSCRKVQGPWDERPKTR